MLDDIRAVEIDVFDQRPAMIAIEDDVLVFAERTTSFDYHADCVRRPNRRMRNVRRDEEGFALAHEMIDDAIPFANTHFDVAFHLIKIFFRVDQVKIVPRVRSLDYHHKKIAPIIEITITHRRLKLVPVFFDPMRSEERRVHLGAGWISLYFRLNRTRHKIRVFARRQSVNWGGVMRYFS